MAVDTLEALIGALGGQESGGDYGATNGRTKAAGKYQIMPDNWPSWAKEAGLSSDAPMTPANQEKVARFKITQYWNKFGNPQDVAAAWYSGSPTSAYTPQQLNRKQGNGDEPSIQEYVNQVVGRMGSAGSGGGRVVLPTSRGGPTGNVDAVTGAMGGSSGSAVNDPRRKALADSVDKVIAAYAKGGASAPDISEVQGAISALAAYDANFRNNSTLPDTKAEQAFQDALALGDFKLKYAAQGFSQYANKAGLARDAATAELSGLNSKNAQLGDTFALEKQSGRVSGPSTYSVLPGYDETLKKWNDKFGVGDAPAMPSEADLAGGTQATATGSTIGRGLRSIGDRVGQVGADPGPDTGFAPKFGDNLPEFNPGDPFHTAGVAQANYTPNDTRHTILGTGFGDRGPVILGGIAPLSPGNAGNTWSNGEDYAGQNFWKATKKFGRALDFFGDGTMSAPGGPAVVNDKPKGSGKAPWFKAMGAGAWKNGMAGVASYAAGTPFHPGGPAMMNDGGGAETILPPQGDPFQLPGGPQVANLQAGSAVIPANVPPDEAYQYMQLKRLAGQPGPNPNDPQQAAMRANDPQAQQKAEQSLYQAVVGWLAAHPEATQTPTYTGDGPDPWAHHRQLTGIPADPAQAAVVAENARKAAKAAA